MGFILGSYVSAKWGEKRPYCCLVPPLTRDLDSSSYLPNRFSTSGRRVAPANFRGARLFTEGSLTAGLFSEVRGRRILGSWRSLLVPYSVYPVVTLEPCNEHSVLRETRARLQLREYQIHLDATH